MPAPLRPPTLHEGDRVVVIAPSSPVPADRLDAGLAVLRDWGLDVIEGRHLRDRHDRVGHLAGTDTERATDFTDAWCDASVCAVFIGRGGFGVQRFLDLLDASRLVTAAPKALVGFSDATPLLAWVTTRLGVQSIHGPVVTRIGDGDDRSREHLRRLLFHPSDVTTITTALRPLVVRQAGGVVSGRLAGGNLALLASSLGRVEQGSATGTIVVLEDVAEMPYRLDRELTSLRRAGWFDGAVAVVLGDFIDCGDPQHVQAVLTDRLGDLGIPVWVGAPVGHGPRNLAFPVGAMARVGEGRLTLADDFGWEPGDH